MMNKTVAGSLIGMLVLAGALGSDVRAEQGERAPPGAASRAAARPTSSRSSEGREAPASYAARLASPPGRPLVFTEEREAAATTFVGRHLPELGAVLEQLKQSQPAEYRKVICDLFKTSELLAAMRQEDQGRYELALRAWRIEAQTQLLAAALAAHPDQRPRLTTQIEEAVQELADLQIEQAAYEVKRLEAKARRADGQRKQLESRRGEFVKQRLAAILQVVDRQESTPGNRVVPSPP